MKASLCYRRNEIPLILAGILFSVSTLYLLLVTLVIKFQHDDVYLIGVLNSLGKYVSSALVERLGEGR